MRSLLFKFNQFLLLWILLTIVLYYGRIILIPIAFAALLSMLMAPVCRFLDKKNVHRTFSTLICILILLVVFVFFIVVIAVQVSNFVQDIPAIEARVNAIIASLHNYIENRFNIPVDEQKIILQRQVKKFGQSSRSFLTGFISGLSGLIINLVIILVFTFLFLFGKEKYYNFFLKIFPGTDNRKKKEIINKIGLVAQQYLTGRILSMAVLFILYLIALLIIGIENAFLLAAIAALVNIIPYVGPLLAGVFPFLVALVSYDSFSPAIWVVITFSIIQAIDNYFVTPFVMGGEVKLSALATIFIIICGGYIWGIAGMILFIPMLAIAKIIFDHIPGLEPYGFLIGNPTKESPSQQIKSWFRSRFN
jgi:predicted PurR-regulated permease PerM